MSGISHLEFGSVMEQVAIIMQAKNVSASFAFEEHWQELRSAIESAGRISSKRSVEILDQCQHCFQSLREPMTPEQVQRLNACTGYEDES